MDFHLSQEQQMWRRAVHDFCAAEVRPVAAELDEQASCNTAAFEKMGPMGLLSLNIPERYGGAEMDSIMQQMEEYVK